jgi:hypothetical protein
MSEVRQDVAGVKQDVAELRQDVAKCATKEELAEVRQDVAGLKQDFGVMDGKLDRIILFLGMPAA